MNNPSDINIDDNGQLLGDEYNNTDKESNYINPSSLLCFDDHDYSMMYARNNERMDLVKQRLKLNDQPLLDFAENNNEKPLVSENNQEKTIDADLKLPESLNIFSDDSKQCNKRQDQSDLINDQVSKSGCTEKRFIKSSLSVNEDLGTRSKNYFKNFYTCKKIR